MAVVKVIELLAESEKGWEDAVQIAINEASKTVRNIQSVYIKDMQATVQNNRVKSYRVNAKISFIVE